MEQILYILIWYTIINIPSFLVFVIIEKKFGNLMQDKISIFFFSKAIFILGFCYLYYILTIINIFQNTQKHVALFYMAIVFILIILYFLKIKKIKIQSWMIFAEFGNFLPYIFYIYIRSLEPKIEGIEKIMDFAILKSLLKSTTIPPQDIWFSLSHINYYYFGHFIFSTFTLLTKIPPEITYNLSVATIFSLSFSFGFGLVYFLTKKKTVALISASLLVFGGNLNYVFHILDLNNYYFADARSLMKYAITEFPAYSFIIGDLHAHILNIPFVLFFIFLIATYFKNAKTNPPLVLLISYGISILFGINSWDAFTYSCLFGLLILYNFKKQATDLLYFAIGLVVFTTPFYIFFKPAVSGIGFKYNLDEKSHLSMFGHFLIIGIVFLIYYLFKKHKKGKLLILIAITLSYTFLISILSQVFYLKDIYSIYNPPYYRANTIFKFWYQAFLIFSIFSPVIIYKLIKLIKIKNLRIIFYTISIGIFIIFISYFYFGVKQFYGFSNFKVTPNIDGIKFLQKVDLDKYNAINFLNLNYKKKITILEKPGEAYTLDSTFSAYTGNPTPLGWVNHELGWRNNWSEILQIQGDIEKIYQSEKIEEAKKLIEKYKIDLVIVDKMNGGKYSTLPSSAIYKIGKVVYKNNSYEILGLL